MGMCWRRADQCSSGHPSLCCSEHLIYDQRVTQVDGVLEQARSAAGMVQNRVGHVFRGQAQPDSHDFVLSARARPRSTFQPSSHDNLSPLSW